MEILQPFAPSLYNCSKFMQTVERAKEWNEAVKKMIAGNQVLHKMTTYVDVYDASLNRPHIDHIHLEDSWYKSIGNWFARVITEVNYK